MPVYIHQADALQRMGAVEGPQWEQAQGKNLDSPYGFHAWLTAWNTKQAMGPDYAEDPVREFLSSPGDGVIYGDGGYARYAVRPDGELVLLGSTTRPERQRAARDQGFRVL